MKNLHIPWKFLRQILALFCAALVCTALWAEAEQTQLADKVIRLHVIANSDSQADQALKLQVRDQVLAQADTLLSGRESAQQAAEILRDNLTPLAETAAQTVSQAGFSYQVQVSLEDTWFPTRQYGDLSLPAGQYQALRVVIGQGEGKNWWCVVFPPLCAETTSDLVVRGLSFPVPAGGERTGTPDSGSHWAGLRPAHRVLPALCHQV